jgi:hypothetical protein
VTPQLQSKNASEPKRFASIRDVFPAHKLTK